MSQNTAYLAFDYGASSGRLMLAVYDGERLKLEEIHRFANEPVWMNGHFYWDFPRLFHEMKQGLKKAARLGSGLCVSGPGRPDDFQSFLLQGSQKRQGHG